MRILRLFMDLVYHYPKRKSIVFVNTSYFLCPLSNFALSVCAHRKKEEGNKSRPPRETAFVYVLSD